MKISIGHPVLAQEPTVSSVSTLVDAAVAAEEVVYGYVKYGRRQRIDNHPDDLTTSQTVICRRPVSAAVCTLENAVARSRIDDPRLGRINHDARDRCTAKAIIIVGPISGAIDALIHWASCA